MKKFVTLTLLLALTLLTSTVFATEYYVSALIGDNSYSGTSPGQPFATIKKAADLTNPGDIVYIMNGTYTPVSNFQQSIVSITRSGTPDAYITYMAYPGHTPKLKLLTGLNFQIWRAVAIDASYIIVSGLEIEGTNQLLNYNDAYQTWQDYENNIKDWNKISMYNCGSISIGGGAAAHHVIVKDCKIHDTGGGIGAFNCDYVTIENNLVYNTCWYSMYAGSGISILDPRSIDNVTSYKMFIRNNVVHNNKCLIPWERINALSDGNGIILDVNIGNGTTTLPYVGRYLVENNVSYNNGGGGIHGFKAAHVDIINNTAYNNGTVVGYPEIDANQCSDFKIYNNIMYARSGGNCNGNDANTIYDYNQYFNGPSFKNGPNDRTGNPLFVQPGTTATANFRLQATSPAINNGSNVAGQFSPVDILGIARPVGFSSDKGAYEYPTVIARAEMKISQGATEIVDNSGTFDFGDVPSTAPKTVTFTITNLGDLGLNLTGTPRVTVAGIGFSLTADAPTTVAANGSVSFDVTLSPTAAAGNYAGTISIANSDADENPYNFAITGYGYDGNKALQTITFNPLPVKMSTEANFNPGATSSAGLPITYTSSAPGVATIAGGHIDLIAPGTTTITASQPGDGSTNPARSVTQLLTVTPVLPAAGSNMISNPTFDVNTTGWSFAFRNSGAATVTSVPMAGSSTNVGKVVVSNLGTTTGQDNVQLSTRVFLIKDRNYLISFKASADAPRNITMRLLMDVSPFQTLHTVSNIPLTTTQSTFGTYAYTSTFTGYVALRFWVAGVNIPVYIDDVTMIEEAPIVLSPEMTVKQNGVEIADNTGTFGFGDVTMGSSKTVTFTIENTGNNNLDFTGNPRVTVNGTGFSLEQDANGNLAPGASTTFQLKFEPNAATAANGTISIANNDPNENPYNFAITGTGVKKAQTITFDDPAPITYGEAYPTLSATSSSGLPIAYSVVSGPGAITAGNTLTYTGAGAVVVEAAQTGDGTYNAAAPVQKTFTVNQKELVVTADDKTVTYGDDAPAYTYTITGFAFNETAADLGGTPALSSTYTPTTPHTETPVISCSAGTLNSTNYSFKTVDGKITIIPTPEITVKQASTDIPSNGSYDFGDVIAGTSKTVSFTIENVGYNTLLLSGTPKVVVTGEGFSLVADAPASIDAAGNGTFEIELAANSVGDLNGTVIIASNDSDENPYSFTLTAKGLKKNQSITFNTIPGITYGDANITLDATSTSGLPIAYSVVSGPASVTGNTLSYTGAGDITIEAVQAGNDFYNAASPVQQTVTVQKKELVVTADDKKVTYGDDVPAYTYTITGFAFNETAGDLAGTPALSSTYTPTTPHTENPVISCLAGTLSSTNYSFKTVDGKITIIPTPEITVKQASTDIPSNGSYDFGSVIVGTSKTVSFTIENVGYNALLLSGTPKVVVTGEGFSLVADAPASIDASGNATFEIKLAPNTVGDFNATVSITSNDRDENPYTFSLSGKAIKAGQSITFNPLPAITYGDGSVTLNATSTSGLPVTYSIVSGPGTITGNTLSHSGVGAITVKAQQAGNEYYNAASPVEQILNVNRKELVVTADNKTVTYGDPAPAYTYTITGFVNNETTNVINGNPVLSSSYTSATPATESPAIVTNSGTLSGANYTFTTVNGQVYINHTFPQLLEAELAKLNGGSIVKTFPGYTGTGYVDHVNKAIDFVEWTANVSGEGICILKFRYALNNPSQDLALTINGSTTTINVRFTNTGDWRNWGIVSVPVYLHAGINSIKLNGGGIAGPNFDHLQINSNIYQTEQLVSNAISSSVSTLETKLEDVVSNDIKVYPIPAINEVKVNLSAKNNEKIVVSIVDMHGRVVYSKLYIANEGMNTLALNVSNLSHGTYVLKVNGSGMLKSKMIVVGK